MLMDLLKSKRLWVMIVTLLVHYLAKYHVVLSDANVDAIADQCVLIIGPMCVIGTKVMDSRSAQKTQNMLQGYNQVAKTNS